MFKTANHYFTSEFLCRRNYHLPKKKLMKKILLLLNIVFATVIYFQNCTMPKQVISPLEGSNKNWHCLNYNDSVFTGIPYSVAQRMFDNYSTVQYADITNPSASAGALAQDSRSVWLSLDVIKKFIYKIEDTLFRKGADQKTRLGIRFYFAAYPDENTMAADPALRDLPREYALHHTLFLVPTFDKAEENNNVHYDFNPFYPVDNRLRRPVDFLTARSSMKKEAFQNQVTLSLGVTGETYMQNHGEVGPPPKPVLGATFP